jgi:hypothetical protein
MRIQIDRKKFTTDLRFYKFVVVGNHSFFYFLKTFVENLDGVKFKELVIGDAGLLDEEKEWIQSVVDNVSFVDLIFNTKEDVQHMSTEYKNIVHARANLWYQMMNSGEPFIHFDADTAIVSNDFSMLDFEADLTITTRPVPPHMHREKKYDQHYINNGVIFFHQPDRCMELMGEYINRMASHPHMYDENVQQYEQPMFYDALKTIEPWGRLNVQRVACKYYNCYEPAWVNPRTSVLHFRSMGGALSQEERVKRFV